MDDESYLNKRGLTHFWENIDDLKLDVDGTSYRTTSIPYGACDNTSTSTVFTATVSGITELRDGVCMWLKNGVVTSASGFTININGLGAKPVYSNMAAASADTTIFNVNYTMFFVYDSTRVAGGCWVLYRGYNSDNNTIGYQIRTNSTALTTTDRTRYYRLLFTSADNTQWVPANTQYDNSATSSKTVNQRKINPFGRIVYMTGTTNVPAGSAVGATTTWDQYTLNLGYSFAKGSALTMTYPKPVYVKCAPQSDGSAIIDSTTPWVQDLPTTEDGKIYIFLGIAYSATNIELQFNHPVYEYKNGMIRPYVNADIPTKTSDLVNDGSSGTSTYVEADELSPQVSGVGDTVTLDNTSDCTSLDVSTLYGDTTQQTYTGKNLFSVSFQTGTSPDEKNAFSLVKPDTRTAKFDFPTHLSAGTYTLSMNIVSNSAPSGLRINFGRENNQNIDSVSFSGTGNKSHTVTVPDGVELYYLYFYIVSTDSDGSSVSVDNVMLEQGASVSQYEPYVGGIPSPNPDYPQTVETVTGGQTVEIMGKNLFNKSTTPTFTSGVSITELPTGIRATLTDAQTLRNVRYDSGLDMSVGQTITISANISASGTNDGRVAFATGKADGSDRTTRGYFDTSGSASFTLTSEMASTPRIWLYFYGNTSSQSSSIGDYVDYTDVQLELGDQATTYEPYQWQSYEINLGKNLWGGFVSSFTFSSNGISGYINNTDGTISIPAGTTTGTSYSCDLTTATNNNYFITLKAGSYVVSGGTSDATLQVITSSNTSLGTSFTITSDTKVFIRTRISSGVTMTATTIKPQIEAGSVVTSYAPYFTPIELVKIGDYQDYIWNDNGTWKIHKETGKQTFTGSENWGLVSNSSSVFYIDNVIQDFVTSNNVPMADYFLGASNVAGNAGGRDLADNTMAFMRGSSPSRLYIRASQFNNVIADFKTWLSTHNTTVYYALATPTDTTITNTTLVAQLDTLYNGATGHNGQTNIFVLTPSPNLPGSLDVVAYPDSAISVATNKRAGIVKIGNGLNIDECGTLSLPETVYVTIEYGNSFNIASSGTGPLIVDNVTEQRSFCPFVVTPGTYTLYNENTNANITIDELYGLLESGKKVVLNNVCLGVSRYDDNGNITIDFNGFSSNIELSAIREITYEGDVTAHNTVYSGSAYSFDSAVAWSSVLGVAISKTVVVGDEGNPTYNLVIDGVKGYRK